MGKFKLRAVASVDNNGLMYISNRKQFDRDVKQAFTSKRILIEVSEYQKDHSSEQRGYYRGIVVPEILEGLVDIGYKRHELSLTIVHEMLKEKFLTKELVNEKTGEFIKIIQSTEDLRMPDYAIFIQECIDWAKEILGITISPPVKQTKMNF